MTLSHLAVGRSYPIWNGFRLNAIGFRNAADKLQQELTVLVQSRSSAGALSAKADYAISVPVLRGLATECALKALARRSTGEHLHVHDLVKLYKNLPTNVRRIVETSALNDGTLPPLEILEGHQNDFEYWRYPSTEHLKTNLVDLSKVLDLLVRTLDHEDFIALCPPEDHGG